MNDKQKNISTQKKNSETKPYVKEIKKEYKLGIQYFENIENKVKEDK